MTNPKVSIVIPVYNGSEFLGAAIDSALAQTYTNREIVVVNDGSSDGGATERVARSYGSLVRYCSQANGGVAAALNRGVAEMTGDYFSWLSHDDLYTNDKLETEVRALVESGRGDAVIYSNYSVFTTDPDKTVAVEMKGVPPGHFRYWITVENRLHGCTLLVPRRAFDTVGGFDARLKTTQDYDLWFRMAKAFPFIHIGDVLVKARSHAGQGSLKMADVVLAECNDLLSSFVRGLDPQEIVDATGRSLADSYSEIASSMFSRGFSDAALVAEELAGRHVEAGSYAVSAGARKVSYLRSRIVHVGRRLLPEPIKQAIKTSLRGDSSRSAAGGVERGAGLKEKFSEVYERNMFGGRRSRSGEGSDLVQTEIVRRELPRIVREYSVATFLDAPCGDWYWMKETRLGVEQYIGVDIVEAMVERHEREFGGPDRKFLCLDLATDHLPKADLIFSRDCLVHLSFDQAMKVIANFKKSGATYLLTTTFVDRSKNNDLVGADSFWRPLNMCRAPFEFPDPVLLVNEGCSEEAGLYADKSLGLWRLSDIRG